ncbi:copper chaperone PCu(A)C [Solwaraspora sp. WMMD1047]|uniref:copper chaperone PCu(A)C n=1 Tax=Solwaraspora sp. WMMD1047 TaxID=3016102 RepID=UPI0024164887|nr:copper chaperone PCu(A)C [Solwaraspora sp. WMMD1047]MDG4832950.1 copper chaperone PCu(A)C [Solwaraspora sp. WMMD1047]
MRRSVSTGKRGWAATFAVTAVAVFATAGCGATDDTSGAAPSPVPSASADGSTFMVRDPWIKAADEGMTAAFGTLVNNTDADVTITGVSTTVSPMEVHEMAMQDGRMVMRPKADGITIKAGASHVLEPGGDHFMLMDLNSPVRAGDELTFTLTFADGATAEFTAVAKPFTGAEESYDPSSGMPMSPGPGMTMSPAP